MIKIGSDFSGVGAFNQALIRLGIKYKELFACDMDKYARQTFIHNYGEPEYYPTNVYEREIPKESLDIYMTSPPCQAFSLAGKRLGKDDKRGILFFNSYEFIQVNKPRYFIFENVRGLLSDDNGKTFQEWVNMLGGKSVNGVPVIFPYEESVPYHLYWQVLNAKNHGVPQNRERVFLIGIRDDSDNNFQFPKEEHLTKKLKDVLEENVTEKYFVTQKKIDYLDRSDKTGWGKNFIEKTKDVAYCIDAGYYKGYRAATVVKVGTWRTHKDGQGFRQIEDGNCPTIPARAREDGSGQPVIKIKYNDKRLNETIEKNELNKGEIKAIDTYNKKVQDNAPTLTEPHHNTTRLWDGYKIRRLTPRECFRLMDFPDSFTWNVSDSQAYKQAGNSIVVNVLYKIIKNLKL
jgi:DNA (cytosine-5)-methyltransferase 1